ncbi:MAG: DUF1569 domain-containing protein [Thermoanaerobaculia bacterium]
MKTIFRDSDRNALLGRIDAVVPSATPRWGSMNASQMLSHLAQSARMATGELPSKPRRLAMRFTPLRQFFVYLLPVPKGIATARELLPVDGAELEASRAELLRLLDRIAQKQDAWPEHPAFGRMSRREWGVLLYKHFDHHLRQFGV